MDQRARATTFSFLLTYLLLAPPTLAQPRTLTLDPAATKITFTLGAVLHTVHGTAKLSAGELSVDAASGVLSGRIVVAAQSAATGNSGRDEKMHAEILESKRYPEITLVVEGFTGPLPSNGTGTITVRAKLGIHGAEHPLELPAEVTVSGNSVQAKLSFSVPYVKWGMSDPSSFILRVDKEVRVTIEAVGSFRVGERRD